MELSQILQQIDSLKKEADDLQPVKPEFERVFWEKFRLEFNYNSNHMEGNTLTYGHTQLLLIFGKVTADYSFRELEEMKAHDAALKKIKEDAVNHEFAFTEKFIKEINEIILVEPYYRDAKDINGNPSKKLIKPGNYKELPNHVELQNGEIFYFSQPEETRAHMGDLMDWFRKESEKKELHPVQLAALFHYRFVRIHPFDDGNGRTARLLMNYILLRHGYSPVVIQSLDKKNYLAALNKADSGELSAFIKYISPPALKWGNLYRNAIKGEKIEDTDDFEKEIELLKKNINDNTKVKMVFSANRALSIFQGSILPLIQQLAQKLSLLDQFYHSKTMQFGFTGLRYVVVNLDQIATLTLNNVDKITLNGTIDFQYIHKGLSTKRSGVVDHYSYIGVRLHEYTYSLITQQGAKSFLEKKYHQQLSETEISDIISEVSNTALDYTKKYTS